MAKSAIGAARSMIANSASFPEAHSGLVTTNSRIWPVFLLQKQADQGSELNAKLPSLGRPARAFIASSA
jgi:hypothetical protein